MQRSIIFTIAAIRGSDLSNGLESWACNCTICGRMFLWSSFLNLICSVRERMLIGRSMTEGEWMCVESGGS